jgi:uncharacterized membrane protein YhhN
VTTAAWVFLALAGVFAVADWVAIIRGDRRLEYVAKPAATLALAATAATLDAAHTDTQVLFVIALLASTAGDVFLMLPKDRFVPGLASFLVAQLVYTVGFALAGGEAIDYVIGAVVAGVAVTPLALRFIGALRAKGQQALIPPLVAYMTAISAMLVTAIGSGNVYAIVGALLFTTSDALIAETRFVRGGTEQAGESERSGAGLAIMVTYYLAQAGLVLSLLP